MAMITSNLARANHPSRVVVTRATDEGKLSGLLSDSLVMTDNLATVLEAAIDRPIGKFPMTEVDAALRHTVGLT